jgi:hypothetical protein
MIGRKIEKMAAHQRTNGSARIADSNRNGQFYRGAHVMLTLARGSRENTRDVHLS